MPDIEKTLKYVKMVAEHRGWALVPDEFFLNGLVEGLAVNMERYGYRSCPCRESTEDKEKDKDIICPCAYAEPDIKEHGHCFCNLFFSKAYLEKGGEPKPIPERRPVEKIP